MNIAPILVALGFYFIPTLIVLLVFRYQEYRDKPHKLSMENHRNNIMKIMLRLREANGDIK